MSTSHFSRKDWGDYTAVGSRGQRHGVIGHMGADVMSWLAAHPRFDGSLYFDYLNGEGQIEVTETFLGEDADDCRAHSEVVEAA